MRIGVSPHMQNWQAWEQPRYGFTVQLNGTRAWVGTLLSADLAWTSWKRVLRASGASKRRMTASW